MKKLFLSSLIIVVVTTAFIPVNVVQAEANSSKKIIYSEKADTTASKLTKKTLVDELPRNTLKKVSDLLATDIAHPLNMSDSARMLPAPGVLGAANPPLNVLVCMMKWRATDPDVNQAALVPVMNQVAAWYDEVSYGQVHMNVQYAGNVRSTSTTPTTHSAETIAAVQTCDPTINFNTVDLIIIFPGRIEGVQTAWGSPSAQSVATQEGQRSIKHVHVGPNSGSVITFLPPLIEHEIGHTFGVNHASSLDCGLISYATNFQNPNSGCAVREYGNYYSAMGYNGIESTFAGHFSGWHKQLMGWIPANTVRTDGVYTLQTLESSAPGNKFMRIPFTAHPICIEYRKPSAGELPLWTNMLHNYISAQHQLDIDSNSMINNGCVFMSVCDANPQNTILATDILIDAHPNSLLNSFHNGRSLDPFDSCVKNGESFTNAAMGVTLSVTTGANNTAVVTLNVDESKL